MGQHGPVGEERVLGSEEKPGRDCRVPFGVYDCLLLVSVLFLVLQTVTDRRIRATRSLVLRGEGNTVH